MKIQGCAVVFNQPSQGLPFVEYIAPEALEGVDLSKVFLLYAHDYQNVLARTEANTLNLDLNENGLFFNASLADTTLAHDVYNDIEAGNVQGVSFGFEIATGGDRWDIDPETGATIHYVTKIQQVTEVSLTPIPAYVQTSVAVQRSLDQFKNSQGGKTAQMNNQDELAKAVEALNKALTALKGGNSAEPKANKEAKAPAERAQNEPGTPSTSVPTTTKAPVTSVPTTTKAPAPTSVPTTTKAPEQRAEPKPDEGKQPDSQTKPDSTSVATTTKAPEGVHSTTQRDDDSDDSEIRANSTHNEKGATNKMAKVITPEKQDKAELQKRSLLKYLKTGKIETRDAASGTEGGIALTDGSVIIPKDIRPVEHETFQFPRLASLVRTVSVKHTTGLLPVFMNSTDKLSAHKEFEGTKAGSFPEVKQINWSLQTYTGKYLFTLELLEDSDYNWESDLASRLGELRDNTNDALIAEALTNGITATQEDDLVAGIKKALNVNLKPQDSRAASIIVSQSAYNELDLLKDGMGRPLIQPDVTKGTGSTLLGKTLVVVEDTVFPNASAGDSTIVVAPLQKAVINFKQSEVTGKFVDSYDVWYKTLGIFLRENVVQARPDLITVIKGASKSSVSTSTSTTTAPASK